MNEEIIKLANELKTNISEQLKDKASIADIEFLKNAVSNAATKEEIEKINLQLQKAIEVVKSIEKTEETNKIIDFKTAYKSNLEKINAKRNLREPGFIKLGSVEKKSAGTITYSHITGTGTFPQPVYIPGLNNLASNRFVLRNISDVGATSSPYVIYVEKQNRDGGANNTGEGLAKTQSDFDLVVSTETCKKITSYMKVSNEMLNDVDWLEAEIRSELDYLINNQEENQLYNGTGLTIYLNGITKYAQTLDLAALQNTFATGQSTRFDAIAAAMTQISANMKQKARPNYILVSPADLFVMQTEKDANGRYNIPPYVVPSGLAVNGVPIVQADFMPAGYFMVGDFSLFHIRDLEALYYSIGWDGNDFTNNLSTILAEKRLVSFVKANDVEAFVYDTFANAKTFLEA